MPRLPDQRGGELQMVRISGATLADQTGLQGYVRAMVLVPPVPRFEKRELGAVRIHDGHVEVSRTPGAG
jgi:hypothetical protein